MSNTREIGYGVLVEGGDYGRLLGLEDNDDFGENFTPFTTEEAARTEAKRATDGISTDPLDLAAPTIKIVRLIAEEV